MKSQHRKQLSLADVTKRRPSAVSVWVALNDLAAERGTHVVTPTRSDLAARTGLAEQTISDALTTLHEAGWISRQVIYRKNAEGVAGLLRIVVQPRKCSAATSTNKGKARRRTRSSTTSTAQDAVDVAEQHHAEGSVDVARRQQTSPTEKSGCAPASAGHPHQQTHPDGQAEQPPPQEITPDDLSRMTVEELQEAYWRRESLKR